MGTLRQCRVTITSIDGVSHVVELAGTSVFEVAAAALAQLKNEGWTDRLSPDAVIRVDVQLPAVTHNVPLRALERWANELGVSPKQELLKRPLRRT